MSTIYDRGQALAKRLLTKHKQGDVRLVVPGEDQPGAEPWDPPVPGEPVEHLLNATVADVDQEMIDNSLIERGDKIVTIAGDVPVMPDPAHHIKIDGVTYTIFDVDPIPAAGVPVAIKVFVRR